jgi:hypothetical protein
LRFVENFLFDKNGGIGPKGDGNGVAWTRIDGTDLILVPKVDESVVSVVPQVTDFYAFDFDIQQVKTVFDQIMCHGTRELDFLQLCCNGGCFQKADPDGKGGFVPRILQDQDGRVGLWVHNKAGNFHLFKHAGSLE